jgi:hypothetical protein
MAGNFKRREEKMRKSIGILAFLGMVVLFMSAAHAQSGIPGKMMVKGVLPEQVDKLNHTTIGKVSLTLGVYDAQGSLLWSERKDDVTLGRNGLYSVILGEQSPLSAELFERGEEYFLGVVVHLEKEEVEILPRQPLFSNGFYALEAQSADRLSGEETVLVPSPQAFSSGQKNPLSDPTYVNSLTAGAGLSGNVKTGAVTLKVKNLGITTAMLADTSVTAGKLAKGAVTASKLAAGAVNSSSLAPESVTTDKMNNTGGTIGQVLTVTGSGTAWQTVKGQKGDPGPQGPAGPAGPGLNLTWYWCSAYWSVCIYDRIRSLSCTCPYGTAISGGFHSDDDMHITDSYPSNYYTTWTVTTEYVGDT